MFRFACIGSREICETEKALCHEIGYYLARKGGVISTGNAQGADQAFASGANLVDPERVELYLPFRGFNSDAIVKGNKVFIPADPAVEGVVSSLYGPRWNHISDFAKKAHMRNYYIVHGTRQVIAIPSLTKSWGGGTGFGIKIAQSLGIEVLNLRVSEHRARIMSKLYPTLQNRIDDPKFCPISGDEHTYKDDGSNTCIVCGEVGTS